MSGFYKITEGKPSFGRVAYQITSNGGIVEAIIYGDRAKADFLLDLYNQVPTMTPAETNLGAWLSAALDDPKACEEFKADIMAWMDDKACARELTARCNMIPKHAWKEVPGTVVASTYDRKLEHGEQRCELCGTRSRFTREKKA